MSSQTIFITKASTNVTVYVDLLQDNSGTNPGDPLTALVFNSAALVCYYVRPLAAAAALILATQTVTGAHSDGGLIEISAANAPGKYRLDLSDAICATGVDYASVILSGFVDLAPHTIHIVLTDVNLYDVIRGGMTALPNVAAEGAGGLYTRGTGAGQINQETAGRIDVDSIAISRSTAAADNLEEGAESIISGTCGTGSTSTNIVSGLTTSIDQFNNAVISFKADTTTVALRGLKTKITDTDASGNLTVVAIPVGDLPVNTDTYIIT